LRPAWILCLAGAIFVAFAGVSWWTARATIREVRRLGGATAVAPEFVAIEPFAVDAMVRQISFTEKSISEEFVDRIVRDLAHLSTVSLVRCRFSDSNLRRFREVPSLSELDLRETETNDATAAVLAELTQVRHLALDGTRVTDAALSELAKLPNLTYVGLSHTGVSDAGLAAFRGHASLRSLDLSHTDVTDEGLEHLHTMNLAYLKLEGTRVTPEGLARFQTRFRGSIFGVSPGFR
jgi:hypothetical protein